MRLALALATVLALGACKTSDGTPIIVDGSLTGIIREAANPGATHRERQATDDAKCRELHFKPGTEAYGNCRLQLEHMRTIRAAAAARTSGPGEEGLSLLCKDALTRRDSGGTFVHC